MYSTTRGTHRIIDLFWGLENKKEWNDCSLIIAITIRLYITVYPMCQKSATNF